MCLCVCVSFCLSAGMSAEPHARYLYEIFVHVAYGRGSILLRQGDEIPKGRGQFGEIRRVVNGHKFDAGSGHSFILIRQMPAVVIIKLEDTESRQLR